MLVSDKSSTLVSVLIPVYNSEKFIRKTIDSVLGQTFKDFEVLLLDDGSADKSSEIIKSYTDDRVKYIPCSHDFIKTLNHGIDIAKGKYIALLDHDDLMLPHRLKVQYEYMRWVYAFFWNVFPIDESTFNLFGYRKNNDHSVSYDEPDRIYPERCAV